jgi:hypothetical protein
MDEIEAAERDDEDEPSGELMEEAHGLDGVPVLDAKAGTEDAHGVGGDGDGDGHEGEQDAAGDAGLHEVTEDDGDGEQAHERADAAAGLGDFELHGGELDDIAFAQDGDAGEREQKAGGLGRADLGKVMWFMMRVGKGMASSITKRMKRERERVGVPRRVQMRPAASRTKEVRERKRSAPSTPRRRIKRAIRMRGRPVHWERMGVWRKRWRLSQMRKATKKGMRKPWESSGKVYQSLTSLTPMRA